MNPLRALIVDDSSVMRKIVCRSIRQAGLVVAEVFEASNGAEALAQLQETCVDLILSDINLPTMGSGVIWSGVIWNGIPIETMFILAKLVPAKAGRGNPVLVAWPSWP